MGVTRLSHARYTLRSNQLYAPEIALWRLRKIIPREDSMPAGPHAETKARRCSWQRIAGASVAVLAVFALVATVRQRGVGAQGPQQRPLTAEVVVAAFRSGGLPVNDLVTQPVVSTPSGPPASEQEVRRFSIPDVAPSGGRIMVFPSGEKLNQKAAWFRRAGATVVVHHNIILWLDPALDPPLAARYRQALQSVQ